jgi:beta-1,2-mannobiose phosphorylase / 1,2-beta-oligomannan phosphorylase
MKLPLHRQFTRCLLRPADLKPGNPGFEVIGAFNPAAIDLGDRVALLIRVAERPGETRPGRVALPYWDWRKREAVVEWRGEDEVEWIDPRVVRLRSSRAVRLTFLSWLQVAFSRDGLTIDELGGAFMPETRYETYGVEDPRLTRIDGRVWCTYVAVSENGIVTALASTDDFQSFRRHGTIFCPENKDVVLFPERIDGRYAALHRPNPSARFSLPEIWTARSPDLLHWGRHERLLGSEVAWADAKIGGGTPPLKTDRGWLALFHGHIQSRTPGDVGQYAGATLLLDLERPERILGISPGPVMVAEEEFERRGFLPNIVFPTAMVRRNDLVDVYYGAADTSTGVVRYALADLLDSVTPPNSV